MSLTSHVRPGSLMLVTLFMVLLWLGTRRYGTAASGGGGNGGGGNVIRTDQGAAGAGAGPGSAGAAVGRGMGVGNLSAAVPNTSLTAAEVLLLRPGFHIMPPGGGWCVAAVTFGL